MYNFAKLIIISGCSSLVCSYGVRADAAENRSFQDHMAVQKKTFQQLSLGDAYARAGDFDEAVRCFQKAVTLYPDRADLHFRLACAAWNAREVELASEHFLKATQPDNHFADAYFGLAKCKEEVKNINEAIAAFKECVRLKPSYAAGWFELGKAYELVPDDVNAKDAYSMCLSSDEVSATIRDKAKAALQKLKSMRHKDAS